MTTPNEEQDGGPPIYGQGARTWVPDRAKRTFPTKACDIEDEKPKDPHVTVPVTAVTNAGRSTYLVCTEDIPDGVWVTKGAIQEIWPGEVLMRRSTARRNGLAYDG